MTWQQTVLVAIIAVSNLGTIGSIGRKRDTLTPKTAVLVTIVNCGLIALIVTI